MTADEILKEVAASHGVPLREIRSKKRFQTLVKARREFIKRAKRERNLSDGQIGRLINRTSWTVFYHRNDGRRSNVRSH